MYATVLSSLSGLRLLPAIWSGAWPGKAIDRQEAEAADRPLFPGQSVSEILGSVRALVADEADLLAAEANVAVRTLVACVVFAVAAAVLGVLGIAALLAMIAMQIVESGYSWPVALGCVFLTCALGSAALVFALRGLTLQELFAASRGELRGKV
jgi:uncharacterized membrane protein YqjE